MNIPECDFRLKQHLWVVTQFSNVAAIDDQLIEDLQMPSAERDVIGVRSG
jgi:hypothetical protein